MSERITLAEYRTTTATPRGKKPTTKRPAAPTEHAEQAALIAWARTNEARYPQLTLLLAIPNGAKLPYGKRKDGSRFSREAMKLKAEGLKNGTPDLFLACPKPGSAGLFIEMKRARKSLSRTSDDQKAMIERLRAVGYRAEVCYGWEAARDVLLSYLGGA